MAGMSRSYPSATRMTGLDITKCLLASVQQGLRSSRRGWSCLTTFPVTGFQSLFTLSFLSSDRGAGRVGLSRCSRQWSPRGWPRCRKLNKTWSDTHSTGPCNFPDNISICFQAPGDVFCAHIHTHTSHLLGRLWRSI